MQISIQEASPEEAVDYGALFNQLNQLGIEMLESLDRIHTLIQDIRTDVRAAYSSSEPSGSPELPHDAPSAANPKFIHA